LANQVKKIERVYAVYANYISGDDKTADGTKEKPFLTLTALLQKFPESEHSIQLLKTVEEGYQPAPKTAVKKAKKEIEILEKKAKKEVELQEKKAKIAADELARLEEAKKITIAQDPSLPAPKKVRTVIFM
jgi:asparaginyl-tRNA synthetase